MKTHLDSWVSTVIHHQEETRNNCVMEFLLEDWSKVCCHLANGITCCISNSGMGILQEPDDSIHDLKEYFVYSCHVV